MPAAQLAVTAILDPSPRYAGTIHDDAAARAAGYRAALIPGAFIYGHATRLALDLWGEDWLHRGTARVNFRRPVYNGDPLSITCGPLVSDENGVEGPLSVRHAESGEVVLDGAMGLPSAPASAPENLPLLEPFDPKLVVLPGGIEPGLQLGSPWTALTNEVVAQSLADFKETAPIYRARGLIHSGCLLRKTMSDAMGNLELPMPMIFVGADIQNHATAEVGRRYATSAKVTDVWEKRGKSYFETDEWLIDDDMRIIARHRRRNLYAMASDPAPTH